MRRGLGVFAGAALLLGLLLLGWSWAVLDHPPRRFDPRPGERFDVALVPSGDPGNTRTEAAVGMWRRGEVGRVVISGHGYGGDSAEYLAQAALDLGASPDALVLEPEATSTVENMARSRPILDRLGARSVIILTSTLHARRAALLGERGLGPRRVAAVGVPSGREQPRHRASELMKLWYWALAGELPLSGPLSR